MNWGNWRRENKGLGQCPSLPSLFCPPQYQQLKWEKHFEVVKKEN